MDTETAVTHLDILTQAAPREWLKVEVEYGVESIALVRCCGEVCDATVGKLLSSIDAAVKCDYTTVIFDFTYCICNDKAVERVFASALQRNVTALSTTLISKMASFWGCTLAEAFRKLTHRPAFVNKLDDGQPMHPPLKSDPNMAVAVLPPQMAEKS